MTYEFEQNKLQELLELVTEEDKVLVDGKDFLQLFGQGAARGRRPIEVDRELFEKTVSRWKAKELTAREAMDILGLKPNTFYRRIKERTEEMLNIDLNNEERRENLRRGAEELRTGLKTIAEQAKADLGEVKAAVEGKAEALDMERERIQEKLNAELSHMERVAELRETVEAEAAELKKQKRE